MPRRKPDSKTAKSELSPAYYAELGLRIDQVIDMYPSRKAAADTAGVSVDQLNFYVKARSKPPFPVLARLATPKRVSLDWLSTGKGQMYVAGAPTAEELRDRSAIVAGVPGLSGTPSQWPAAHEMPDDFVLVPKARMRAGAGGGQLVESPQIVDWLAFRTDWVKNRLRVDPKHLVLVEAVGESMAPTIHDGDLLLLNTAVARIAADAVYCIAVEGELLVKRVQRQGDGVLLSSDNPAYKPETLDRERAGQLKIVGRVVWHGGVL